MAPDFNKTVTETLAKRAGTMCSNVDCRAITSGPADAHEKSISIGEAAHIHGGKLGSARYRADMTDVSRAEITNGIWLCRNCHKKVDSDPSQFPSELLFRWRELHEQYVISKLGTPTEKMRLEIEIKANDQFSNESALVRQIIRDRPPGWEYRLTAELLREYLTRELRGWRDLQRSLYVRATTMVSDENAIDWFRARLDEGMRLVAALAALITDELARSWGTQDEKSDPAEISHVCKLIRAAAGQLLAWEEAVRFVSVGESHRELFACLPGIAGRQLDVIKDVPHRIDEVTDWLEVNPGVARTFDFKLVFTLPDGWVERVQKEMSKIEKAHSWF
jgi:hypothetical protein